MPHHKRRRHWMARATSHHVKPHKHPNVDEPRRQEMRARATDREAVFDLGDQRCRLPPVRRNDMGKYAVKRTEPIDTAEVTWQTDVGLLWVDDDAACRITAEYSYKGAADVRLVLWRRDEEHVLIQGLLTMSASSVSIVELLEAADEIALQYRSLTPADTVKSDRASLTVETVK